MTGHEAGSGPAGGWTMEIRKLTEDVMSVERESEKSIGNPVVRGSAVLHVLGWVLGAGAVGILGFTALSSTGYWLMLPPTLRYAAFALVGLLIASAGLAFRWLSRRPVRRAMAVSTVRRVPPYDR